MKTSAGIFFAAGVLTAVIALPLFASLTAVGWIPIAYREQYYGQTGAEVPYKVTNIGSDQVNSMQIVIPEGFTFRSFGPITAANTTGGSLPNHWSAHYSPGVVSLSADTYVDAISSGQYVSLSIFVDTKNDFQPATKWECLVTSTQNATAPAAEVSPGDMKVTIIVLSLRGDVEKTPLLPGATTQVSALLLDDYGLPMAGKIINFSITQGNGQLESSASPVTNSNGVASAAYRASTSPGTDALLASYTAKTTGIITIAVADDAPSMRIDTLSNNRNTVYYIKENTPLSFAAHLHWQVQYRVDDGPWLDYSAPFTLQGEETGVHTIYYRYKDSSGVGTEASLSVSLTRLETDTSRFNNFPNPFSPGIEDTAFEYYLDGESNVTLTVYDLFGNLVWSKDIASGDPGALSNRWNQIIWNGRNNANMVIANGGYIGMLRINNSGKTMKHKVAALK